MSSRSVSNSSAAGGNGVVAKRTPIRTCVACRTAGGKRGLLRVVRLPDGGEVALDATGKVSGRGAYVCETTSCLMLALKKKQLDRSLKTTLSETLNADLRTRAESLASETMPAPTPVEIQKSVPNAPPG